ncbi:MAG: T9SS type A sorting domain-containing protein, partial [Xanthomarina sp.]
SYITGDDVVYAFTPADNGTYNFDLSDTVGGWVGFWLFEGCPFATTVAYHTATSGATRSLPSIELVAGTTYYVVISTWPSPQSTPYKLDITLNALSIGDFQSPELFKYYPNPVTNILTLKAQKNIQNVAVFNMLGQEVLRSVPNTVDSEVNMTSLQAGAYFVKVMIDNNMETIRIIKN